LSFDFEFFPSFQQNKAITKQFKKKKSDSQRWASLIPWAVSRETR
jgi:hypothetical protein